MRCPSLIRCLLLGATLLACASAADATRDAPKGSYLVTNYTYYLYIARRYDLGAYPGRFVVIHVVWIPASQAASMGWWGGYNQWGYTLYESDGRVLSADGWNGQPPDFTGFKTFTDFCAGVKTSPGWLIDIDANDYAPMAWLDQRLRGNGDLDEHPLTDVPAPAPAPTTCP